MASCPTIRSQAIRGVIAVAAFTGAYFGYAYSPLLSCALIGVSLFAMRGCPACWAAGMFEAVKKKPDVKGDDVSS